MKRAHTHDDMNNLLRLVLQGRAAGLAWNDAIKTAARSWWAPLLPQQPVEGGSAERTEDAIVVEMKARGWPGRTGLGLL